MKISFFLLIKILFALYVYFIPYDWLISYPLSYVLFKNASAMVAQNTMAYKNVLSAFFFFGLIANLDWVDEIHRPICRELINIKRHNNLKCQKKINIHINRLQSVQILNHNQVSITIHRQLGMQDIFAIV
jgi:hypothetical protein